MLKLIEIILALVPIFFLLRSILAGRVRKRSQLMTAFKQQVDYAVWVILFFIAISVIYGVGKLIYQFWP